MLTRPTSYSVLLLLFAAVLAFASTSCGADQKAAPPKLIIDDKAGTVTIPATAAPSCERVARDTPVADSAPQLEKFGLVFEAPTAKEIHDALTKIGVGPGSSLRVTFQLVAPALRRVHVFISGGVQGVGFRDFTQRSARSLKLTGWVRNLKDGRVEATVEGPRAEVEKLLELMKKGPSSARVTKLEAADEESKGEFKDFEVQR